MLGIFEIALLKEALYLLIANTSVFFTPNKIDLLELISQNNIAYCEFEAGNDPVCSQ